MILPPGNFQALISCRQALEDTIINAFFHRKLISCEKTLRARGRDHFPLLRRLRRAKNAPRTGAESYCAHAVTVRGRNRSAHGEQDRAEAAFRSVSARGRRQKALSFCHHFFFFSTLTIRYIAPDIISTRPLIK